jgi:inner membrane transporter RhtA
MSNEGERGAGALPYVAAAASMASFQVGAGVAKGIFPAIGANGAVALRLSFGALLLLVLMRPWRHWPKDAPLAPLLAAGAAIAVTIFAFYEALARLPLGVAISLQFLGPLVIALIGSRKASHFLWAALAAAGVYSLVTPSSPVGRLDPLGIAWAMAAAAGWASYIVLGRKAGALFGRATGAASLCIAALLVLPFGAARAIPAFADPQLMGAVLLMALFAAAIPFSLEFYALPRVPARTFAVLTSLEPAFGVLCGWLLLGEQLALVQMAGVAMVMGAAAGAAWSSSERAAPAVD